MLASQLLVGAAQAVEVYGGDIAKAPSDKRQYRGVTLDNGLRVMLVSDPTAVSASAAVDVNIGAFSDPDDRPGLAHFCEHMLFLSTQAYPKENEYFRFLSQHGGHANAYTASTHTNFFFDVQPDQLERALDRFAQFFVGPLFNPDAVDRELHAVASEHSKNLQSDAWRKRQLLKSFSSPHHPYYKFSTGSIETLLPDNKSSAALREQLVKWYNSSYSAPLMTLTVSGKHNLSTLQEWATTKFSKVPNHPGVKVPDFSSKPRPYAESDLPKGYVVKPVKNLQEVTLQWPLAGLQHLTAEKPLKTLGFLLGGESKGSLLSLLIDKGWAEGLIAGAGDAEDDFSIFEIKVALTPLGTDHWPDVVSTVFSAIRMTKKGMENAHEAARIHKMVHGADELGFNYKEEEEASGYTSELATNLHLYQPEALLYGPSVTTAFNASRLSSLLGQMTPKRLLLLYANYKDNLTDTQQEKWYGTRYASLELPTAALAQWSSPAVLPELTLPEDNKFIPDNFTLLAQPPRAAGYTDKGPVEPPRLLFNGSRGTLWHRTETSFGLPMGAMHIMWVVPRVAQSARGAVMAQMLELMVREQLRATSYDAGVAGSAVTVGSTTTGFELSAYGFSQRLPVLLSTLLDNVVALEDGAKGEKLFSTQKTMLLRALQDAAKQSPNSFASQLSLHLTRKVHWLPQQLHDALQNVTLASLRTFSATISGKEESSLEGLVLGNLDADAATAMLSDASKKLVAAELPYAARPRQGIANLNGRALVHSFRHPNGDEPNSAVQLVAQLGRLDARGAATAELLADMLGQPFFDELRTHQQLGYIVGSGLSAPQAVYSLGFVVQSAVQPPAEVSRRILAFLESGPERLTNASDDFADFVAAAQTQLREPPKRLSQATDQLWPRVSEGTYRFSWPQQVADAMDNVTLDDVQAMLGKLLTAPGKGGVGRLLVMVHGKDHGMPSPDVLASKIGDAYVAVTDSAQVQANFYTALMAQRQEPLAKAAASPRKGAAQPTLAASR